jgi:1-acyl-sn-glycerol-3-phosphate acyltransferase
MSLGLYRFVRDVLVRPLARLLWRIEIVGAVPPGPCIVVANHESVLDPLLVPLASRDPVRFMAKEELWRHRWGAWVMDALGSFKVARGRGDRQAFATAEALLREGAVIGLFPEGTVEGGHWHRTAAKLALLTGAPIVPVRLEGTRAAYYRGRLRFPRVRLIVGEPVPVEPARPTLAAARSLTDTVREVVRTLSP